MRKIVENKRLYKIYDGMVQRCTNPNYPRSKDYMGRGITICKEWMDSYEVFQKWAFESGYSDELSIDRIDNDGNYEPSNCRWTTAEVQMNNRRCTRKYEYNGKSLSISQWSRETGLPWDTINGRLKRGWSIERALTEPPINVFVPGWKAYKTIMKGE